MTTNDLRARWAEASLDLFKAYSEVDEPIDAIGDLIANLGHFADRKGLPFLKCVATGIGHWHLEKRDEDSLDPLPNVAIFISD